MIRFSAGLVVVAIGVLVGGVATSKLLLVYIAIGLSVAALIALAIGVVLKREELFGEQQRTTAPAAAVLALSSPFSRQIQAERDGGSSHRPGSRRGVRGHRGGGCPWRRRLRPGSARPSRRSTSPLTVRRLADTAGTCSACPPGKRLLPARDWSAVDAGSRQGRPERPGADTPPPARPGWAFRQDSPWTLEPPAASASWPPRRPAARPGGTAPAAAATPATASPPGKPRRPRRACARPPRPPPPPPPPRQPAAPPRLAQLVRALRPPGRRHHSGQGRAGGVRDRGQVRRNRRRQASGR